MKTILLVAFLSATIASGEDRKPSGTPPVIAVFLSFENLPSEASVEAMKAEAGKVLRKAGIALDWRFVEDNVGTQPASELAVMRFKGTCQVGLSGLPAVHDVAGNGDAVVLASTKTSDGHVLPFSEVECDQIRGYIAPVEKGNAHERETLFGRVMGRVVVHELWHVILRSLKHEPRGPAKSVFTARELASSKFSFPDAAAERLRANAGASAAMPHQMSLLPGSR